VQAATAPEVDTVMSAIVGVAGLAATYAAICLGKRVGLANKEVLVSGGSLIMQAVREHNAELLPVDSEHNGAHQCLRAAIRAQFGLIQLRGPFRNTPRESRRCDAPTRPQSSNLEDGESHHHRLRHPYEQGLRGDRSLLAVRFRS
jgi:1-deoxy-D-xylulose 5-phosphate reductoisomerase